MNKINLIKKIASLTLIGSLVVLPTTLINTSCTNKTNPADYLSTLRLKTTPILKQYNATIVQNFNILENSRIIVDTNSSGDLSNLCNLISQRYYDAEFSFTKLPIISGTELDAQNGDFYLIAKPNAVSESTNVEAYKIVIDSSIKIYANSEQASYYAFNTLLQLRKSNNNNINYGTIID
jgi:hypothetical protein